MLIVNEDTCQQVMTREAAFEAVESVFAAMAKGDAYNFPVIREAIGMRTPSMGSNRASTARASCSD